jgi:hypothetical protein
MVLCGLLKAENRAAPGLSNPTPPVLAVHHARQLIEPQLPLAGWLLQSYEQLSLRHARKALRQKYIGR